MMHAQDARPPEYWLSLADEALKAAERFGDAECKRMMYTVAAAYKRIADAAPRLQQVGELADELVPEALETDPNVRGAELAERARAAASAATPDRSSLKALFDSLSASYLLSGSPSGRGRNYPAGNRPIRRSLLVRMVAPRAIAVFWYGYDQAVNEPPRYWFHAKRYGWGWGLPATWEGWVVLVLWLAVFLFCVRYVVPRNRIAHLAFVVAMVGLLWGICTAKGEPARWRWGDKD